MGEYGPQIRIGLAYLTLKGQCDPQKARQILEPLT